MPAQLLSPDELSRVRQPVQDAWTLPPHVYTDPTIFAAEDVHIFSKEWLCVGHRSQIPNPGDYRCIELGQRPLVITHDHQGEMHALSRVCLHRSMPVAEGCGNARTLTCPYHLWSYDLNGSLRGAPLMEGVNGLRESTPALPELKFEEWRGFLFATLNPDPEPLATKLQGLTEVLKSHPLEELTVVHTTEWEGNWNWKLLNDNFMEVYHHIGPHRLSAEPTYPAANGVIQDNQGAPFVVIRVPANGDLGSELPTFPGLNGPRANDLLVVNGFPNFNFFTTDNILAWYEMNPVAHDRTHLKVHAMVHRDVGAVLPEEAKTAIGEDFQSVHREDLVAIEGPWRSVQSGMAGQGRLSLLEKSIWQLNQLWCDRLGLE